MPSRVCVVIPAFNEAATIASIVASAARYGQPVVVDDGSSDATTGIARSAGASVVTHPANRGYDKALDSGFVRANELGCEYVVTMDADGQHDAADVASFVSALDAGADLVVGIRDRRQRIGESIFGWVGKLRWGVRDPLCGMKAYRISLYRELGHFDSYGSIGTELTIHAARRAKRITQLPVKTRERDDAPRFGRRFGANLRILRALFIGLTGARKR